MKSKETLLTKEMLIQYISNNRSNETIRNLLLQLNIFLDKNRNDKDYEPIRKLSDALIINSGKLSSLEYDKLIGILDYETQKKTIAEIQHSVLFIIEKLPIHFWEYQHLDNKKNAITYKDIYEYSFWHALIVGLIYNTNYPNNQVEVYLGKLNYSLSNVAEKLNINSFFLKDFSDIPQLQDINNEITAKNSQLEGDYDDWYVIGAITPMILITKYIDKTGLTKQQLNYFNFYNLKHQLKLRLLKMDVTYEIIEVIEKMIESLIYNDDKEKYEDSVNKFMDLHLILESISEKSYHKYIN